MQRTIEQLPLFPISVFKWHMGVDKDVLFQIRKLVDDFPDECMPPDDWTCKESGFRTNFHSRRSFISDGVCRQIHDGVEQAVNTYNCTSNPYSIQFYYWFNYYTRGAYQEVHTHAGSQLSGCWFLAGDPNKFTFYKERGSQYFANQVEKVDLQVGDFLLFPSDMSHYVLPSETNEERITVAFNFSTVELL